MANYKQQATASELASALTTRLRADVIYGEVAGVPVALLGTGIAGSQSASIRVQDQRGNVDAGWDDIIGNQQTVWTTGVAQVLVENAGDLPAVVAAFNKVTFASFVADDTVTVNGTLFTGKAVPVGTAQFLIGASNAATAINFAAKVNAHPVASLIVSAAAVGAVVTLTSLIPGGAGNKLTLAISAHGSVTGANFASGTGQAGGMYTLDTTVATNTVVIAGNTLTADAAVQDGDKFVVGIDDTATAANLVTTILANTNLVKYVTAYSSGAKVYVVAKTVGVLGNTITTVGTALRIVAANGTLGGGLGGLLSPTLSQSTINTILLECGSRGLKVEFWVLAGGTAPVFANFASATQYGEFDILPYWPLSGRV